MSPSGCRDEYRWYSSSASVERHAAPLDELIARLDALLEDLVRAGVEHADDIDAVAGHHRRGAVNLVHYTRLRQHDRRELQNDLMDMGATSLATTEAHLRAKVLAARNVLAALGGDSGPWDLEAIDDALDEGDEILDACGIFGPMRAGRPDPDHGDVAV